MIVLLTKPATDQDIKKASADYPDYVKITLDIEKGIVALGGEYHYDAEQVLLEKNSKQKDIWGGGLDLISQELDTVAMINIRPNRNPHQEIQNEKIKNKFLSLTYKFLKKYAKKPASLF